MLPHVHVNRLPIRYFFRWVYGDVGSEYWCIWDIVPHIEVMLFPFREWYEYSFLGSLDVLGFEAVDKCSVPRRFNAVGLIMFFHHLVISVVGPSIIYKVFPEIVFVVSTRMFCFSKNFT